MRPVRRVAELGSLGRVTRYAKSEQFIQRCVEDVCIFYVQRHPFYMLKGVDYLPLYGKEPSAIEQAHAIFANVLEFDESGQVLNAQHAQKRATDYLRAYCVRGFKVEPPYEDWELELHEPPPLKDLK